MRESSIHRQLSICKELLLVDVLQEVQGLQCSIEAKERHGLMAAVRFRVLAMKDGDS